MNSRPFLSTNLNIFDENRCIYSPSIIAGQQVLLSQEQNRKVYDTLTTSICGNQPYPQVANNFLYPPQINQNPCPVQGHRQQVPEGMMFNFPPSNPYCCPQPRLPLEPQWKPFLCPNQAAACPQQLPPLSCADLGRYGLEAMQFQEQMRKKPFLGFTYDKQMATEDLKQVSVTSCKSCCCCCSSIMERDLQVDLKHRIDNSSNTNKLCAESYDANNKIRKCCKCFPRPDPGKYGHPKTLVINERTEKSCRTYDLVEEAETEADFEYFLCCNCLQKWKETKSQSPKCIQLRNSCDSPKDMAEVNEQIPKCLCQYQSKHMCHLSNAPHPANICCFSKETCTIKSGNGLEYEFESCRCTSEESVEPTVEINIPQPKNVTISNNPQHVHVNFDDSARDCSEIDFVVSCLKERNREASLTKIKSNKEEETYNGGASQNPHEEINKIESLENMIEDISERCKCGSQGIRNAIDKSEEEPHSSKNENLLKEVDDDETPEAIEHGKHKLDYEGKKRDITSIESLTKEKQEEKSDKQIKETKTEESDKYVNLTQDIKDLLAEIDNINNRCKCMVSNENRIVKNITENEDDEDRKNPETSDIVKKDICCPCNSQQEEVNYSAQEKTVSDTTTVQKESKRQTVTTVRIKPITSTKITSRELCRCPNKSNEETKRKQVTFLPLDDPLLCSCNMSTSAKIGKFCSSLYKASVQGITSICDCLLPTPNSLKISQSSQSVSETPPDCVKFTYRKVSRSKCIPTCKNINCNRCVCQSITTDQCAQRVRVNVNGENSGLEFNVCQNSCNQTTITF